MAIKMSTGIREGLAITGSLRSLLTGSVIRIYSGSAPTDADSSLGAATLLCEISAGGVGVTFESAAPGGVLSKSAAENWSGTNSASGNASFFRMVLASDTGSASASAIRMQGTVAQISADLELSNISLISGAPLAINAANFTIPAQA